MIDREPIIITQLSLISKLHFYRRFGQISKLMKEDKNKISK